MRRTKRAVLDHTTTYDRPNVACGAYVEAEGIDDWRNIDFAGVRVDGGPTIRTLSGEYFRDPVDILVETVNGLSKRGIDVLSGDLLTTGSLTQPTSIRVGQKYVARFADLATLELTFV